MPSHYQRDPVYGGEYAALCSTMCSASELVSMISVDDTGHVSRAAMQEV